MKAITRVPDVLTSSKVTPKQMKIPEKKTLFTRTIEVHLRGTDKQRLTFIIKTASSSNCKKFSFSLTPSNHLKPLTTFAKNGLNAKSNNISVANTIWIN